MEILTPDEMEAIVDHISDFAKVRKEYSGRGMYGKTCIGFTIKPSDQVKLGVCLTQALGEDRALELADSAAYDGMGRDDIIVYFQGWQADPAWEAQEEKDSDED